MGCDLSSSSSSSSSPSSCPAASLLLDLPLPLLESALSSLPVRSVLALSSASKSLRSLLSSLSFCRLHSLSPPNSSPWFFLFGFDHLVPLKNQAFALDPLSLSWLPLPFSPPPPHNFSSLSAMNATLFALRGAKQNRLCFSSSPLKQNWGEVEAPMEVGRKNPLVGVFCDHLQSLRVRGIIVAGGVDEDDGDSDDLAVEVYDMDKRLWKRCESMPQMLKGKCVSSAVIGGRFFVGDNDGGGLCWLDIGSDRWEERKVEMPRGVVSWQWVGSDRAGLLAVALCAGGGVRIYKMEEGGVKLQEVTEMPEELFELFKEEDEKQLAVRSAGGGNLIYIYSESRFKEYAVCVCELGERGRSRWYKAPPLPATHNFNRVVCVSGAVPLSSLLIQAES